MQILKQEEKEDQEPAIVVVPPKEMIKELLIELKKLKDHKDDLLFPIKDELQEIEEKDKKLRDEITNIMQDVKESVFIDEAKAVWKRMPKPHPYYVAELLDSVTDEHAREIIDSCKKMTMQGEPKVKIEVY